MIQLNRQIRTPSGSEGMKDPKSLVKKEGSEDQKKANETSTRERGTGAARVVVFAEAWGIVGALVITWPCKPPQSQRLTAWQHERVRGDWMCGIRL